MVGGRIHPHLLFEGDQEELGWLVRLGVKYEFATRFCPRRMVPVWPAPVSMSPDWRVSVGVNVPDRERIRTRTPL
jgi:hypothetical protein